MMIKQFFRNHSKVAAFTATTALLVGSFGLNATSAGAYVTNPAGRGGAQATVGCYQDTHQAKFLFNVWSDISGSGTQQVYVYAQSRYRVNGNYAWSGWGGGQWTSSVVPAGGVGPTFGYWGGVSTPGQYQHRFAYYWLHYNSLGQAYWVTSAYDYQKVYEIYPANSWGYRGLDSSVCTV